MCCRCKGNVCFALCVARAPLADLPSRSHLQQHHGWCHRHQAKLPGAVYNLQWWCGIVRHLRPEQRASSTTVLQDGKQTAKALNLLPFRRRRLNRVITPLLSRVDGAGIHHMEVPQVRNEGDSTGLGRLPQVPGNCCCLAGLHCISCSICYKPEPVN